VFFGKNPHQGIPVYFLPHRAQREAPREQRIFRISCPHSPDCNLCELCADMEFFAVKTNGKIGLNGPGKDNQLRFYSEKVEFNLD